MSYRLAAALQAAVYGCLSAEPALAAVAVLDAPPPSSSPTGTFVLLGPEEMRDLSDVSGLGAEHRFTISVISDAAGFLEAKTIAGAVCSALTAASLSITGGHVLALACLGARARRLREGGVRRIDVLFRARVEIDQ